MSSCFPVLRGAQQLQLCCCQYVSIIYSLKLYCFRLVPLIYDVKMWALNMQDWLYFFWAYWASWVWAGHEDTDTWHEDTNLCRTCDILTQTSVLGDPVDIMMSKLITPQPLFRHALLLVWGQNDLRYLHNYDIFLDPVGSLVSTLWVVGRWLLVGHTFSKLVNFECCIVVMMECWSVRVLEY